MLRVSAPVAHAARSLLSHRLGAELTASKGVRSPEPWTRSPQRWARALSRPRAPVLCGEAGGGCSTGSRPVLGRSSCGGDTRPGPCPSHEDACRKGSRQGGTRWRGRRRVPLVGDAGAEPFSSAGAAGGQTDIRARGEPVNYSTASHNQYNIAVCFLVDISGARFNI